MRAPVHALIAALALAAGALPASAQQDRSVTRPDAAGRIVRVFDFEERDTNPLPVPRGWYRAQQDPDAGRERPGFPVWNQAELDYDADAYSGIGTVRLPTKGGSTSLVTRPALIGVFPGADYMVSVRVRTKDLVHAHARLVATLVDQDGDDLEGTRRVSPPVRSAGDWRLVTLFVPGIDDAAASLRLELQLLQPKQQPRDTDPPEFAIWPQDFDGAAWFDDLIIAQVPRIDLSIDDAANIAATDEPPAIRVGVRDMTGDALTTTLTVLDADARVVDARRFEHGATSLRRAWTPALPGRGWYRAHLDVSARGRAIGRRALDFVWAAPPNEPTDQQTDEPTEQQADEPRVSAFALAFESTDPGIVASIPAAVAAAGVRRVEATAAHAQSDPEALAQGSALTSVIDELLDREIEVAVAIAGVPRAVAERAAIEPGRVRELMTDRPEIATPLLGPIMDRYGQIVHDWRLGDEPAEDDARALAASVDRAVDAFAPYVPGARIGVPWPIDRVPAPAVVRPGVTLHLADDPAWSAAGFSDLGALYHDARRRSRAAATTRDAEPPGIEIRCRARDAASHDTLVRDNTAWLARRAISAWWALTPGDPENHHARITLENPLHAEPGARGRVMPRPELVVWRSLAEHLGTRRPISELTLIPGLRMLLCSPPEGSTRPSDGALVVWRTSAAPGRDDLRLPLSMGPVVERGIMGAARVVEPARVTALELPRHEITPGRSPLIITGVNPELLLFLDAIALSPERLDAAPGLHRHTLTIENPWDVPIRGTVYIVEPGGYADEHTRIDRSWEIDPRVVEFSARPLETVETPVEIAYSPAQIARELPLVFDIELAADTQYPLMRLERTIELASDLVELELALGRDPASGRVGVRALVTNTGDDAMLIEVAAIATRHARQESTISAIAPGTRAERRFVFGDLRPGDEVVVSARSPAAGVRLSKRVVIPE